MSFLYTEDSGPKSSCFLFEKQHDVNNNQIELKTQRILIFTCILQRHSQSHQED